MSFATNKLIALTILFFLSLTSQSIASWYYKPSSTGVGYPGTCFFPEAYGSTVEEVGKNWIVKYNKVTTMECSQRCRNPAEFISADEVGMTFVIRSLCTGALYTVKVSPSAIETNFGFPELCTPKP